jgi:hypothetical protein
LGLDWHCTPLILQACNEVAAKDGGSERRQVE